MKAILTEKEISCKGETIRCWEIKSGRKKCATVWFPWSGNFHEYRVEFPHGTITKIPDVTTAAEKCSKWCKEYFGITKIVDKKGYPINLLAAFEDSLFADVC